MAAGPRGSVLGQEVLPTRKVFIGGGILNHERSPVKGTGGGHCVNGCQIHADCRSSSLKVGDDIMDGERCGSEIGSWGSPSLEESQSLQMSVDLLCVYERED